MKFNKIFLKISMELILSSESKYPILFAIMTWVSSSEREPELIYKNWINSFPESLATPSAILDGIETAALRI